MGVELSELYFSTGFFEGLLEGFSFFLAYAFLHLCGSAVNDFLGFLEAETASFLHSLNDLKLCCACALEDNVEGSLLFSSGCTAGCGTGYCHSCGCGFDAVFFLEDGCEFVYFFYSKIYQFFCNCFDVCHCSSYLFVY